MTILAIDGGKNVGYALFTGKGEEIERGVIDFDTFFRDLQISFSTQIAFHSDKSGDWMVDALVVEGFRHDPSVKQGGSLHWASQIEGAVKMISARTGVPHTVQYAGQALPVAKTITGYAGDLTRTGKKKHLPDQDSAWLHGVYFFHCEGVWRDEWKVLQ